MVVLPPPPPPPLPETEDEDVDEADIMMRAAIEFHARASKTNSPSWWVGVATLSSEWTKFMLICPRRGEGAKHNAEYLVRCRSSLCCTVIRGIISLGPWCGNKDSTTNSNIYWLLFNIFYYFLFYLVYWMEFIASYCTC